MILIIITSFKICSAYSDSISTPSVFTTNDFFHFFRRFFTATREPFFNNRIKTTLKKFYMVINMSC